jgi:hypothetical protein
MFIPFLLLLCEFQDDDQAVKDYGVKYLIDMIKKMIANGFMGNFSAFQLFSFLFFFFFALLSYLL